MKTQETPLFIIAGPTASGKSAAALRLAKASGGAIINADSMQVYQDLDVLTARPARAELAAVPHHLYGHVDGGARYSAGRFIKEAGALIADLRQRQTPAILCGGTGLYVKALTEGLSAVPDVPPCEVARQNDLWTEDPAEFRRKLVAEDPSLENLQPTDRQRHVRAASVRAATGQHLSFWHQQPPLKPPVGGPIIASVLAPERSSLYARCDARFDNMLEKGVKAEVKALLSRGLSPSLPVMRALGVRELTALIREEISAEDAAREAKQATRRFAKRQLTWFRNQTNWPAYAAADALINDCERRLEVARTKRR